MNIPHERGVFTRLPKGTKFAAVSELVRQALKPLMPAAQHLFLKLGNQHRAGWVFELDCKEYAEQVGYSLRHVYRAIDQLKQSGLLVVEKVLGSGRRYFKGHWQYPATATDLSEISQACPEKNLEPALDRGLYTDLLKTNPPPTHGVEVEVESKDGHPADDSLKQLYGEALKLGIRLAFKRFSKLLGSFSLKTLTRVLKVVAEQTNLRNPTGFFFYALKQGLEPDRPVLLPNFGDWFDRARKAGIAVGSQQRQDGLYVALRQMEGDCLWVRFEDAYAQLNL